MSMERQQLVNLIDSLEDIGVEEEPIHALAYALAVYEKGLKDEISFLVEALGNVTVTLTVEDAHEIATVALSEVLREQ